VSSDPFLSVQRDLEDAVRPRRAHPKGWEPGVDTARGVIVATSADATPPADWSAIVRELGLDPAVWTVDESQPVQVRSWDSGSQRLYYYRATVVPVRALADRVDVDRLIAAAKRRKAPRLPEAGAGRALVVCLADWQAGKNDAGGFESLLDRVMALKAAVPARVRELQRAGRPIDQLVVAGLGDLMEGCDGHYPMETFSVELDRRAQLRAVRRLILELLTEWAKLAPRVIVLAVPGNHGEHRKGGKAFTTFEDNDDVAVFEVLMEIAAAAPDLFGHFSWVLPSGDMTVTLDLCGTVVGFVHGHQARRAAPKGRLVGWWSDKQAARHPIGDADVLVSAHYHHLAVLQDGPRTWLQCPALDGGSRWFEEQGGPPSVPGTLTFTCDQNGWDDLRVLR
jgi:hypothetical protein